MAPIEDVSPGSTAGQEVVPDTVSWHSAFWTLIPLALNSMAQPSGMVCGFPSKDGFFLRSSPFMCALDTLYLLVQIVACGFRAPRKTLEAVTRRRFRDVPSEDEGGLSSLQKNAPFRFALFFLGAFASIVKMFAYKGIPWTQAFGAMYLGSFLVIEILVIPTQKRLHATASASHKEKVENAIPSHPLITTADDDAAADQMESELYFDHHDTPLASPPSSSLWLSVEERTPKQPGTTSATVSPSPSFNLWTGQRRIEAWFSFLSGSFSYGVAYCSLYVILTSFALHIEHQSYPGFFILGITFEYVIGSVAWSYLPEDSRNPIYLNLGSWACSLTYILFVSVVESYALLICFCILLCAFWFYSLVMDFPKRLNKFLSVRIIEGVNDWWFFLQNLVAAILWYWYYYDPVGTVKPSWINYLG